MQLTDKQAYTPQEVADIMGVTAPTVRKLFAKERGVIIFDCPAKMNKQRYRSMRIPRAVLERVMRGLTVR
jgi:predicted transcriptional regulator